MTVEVPSSMPTIRVFTFEQRHADVPETFADSKVAETDRIVFAQNSGRHVICPISLRLLKPGSICAIVQCCKTVFLKKKLQETLITSGSFYSHTNCPLCRESATPLNLNDMLTYPEKVEAIIREIQKLIEEKKVLKRNTQAQLDNLKTKIRERGIIAKTFFIDPAEDSQDNKELKRLIDEANQSVIFFDQEQLILLQSIVDSLANDLLNLEARLKQFRPLENTIQETQSTIARKALLLKILKISAAVVPIMLLLSYKIFTRNEESCFFG